MTDALLTAGRVVLAAQSLSVHLDAEFEILLEGEAVIRVPVRPEALQHDGYAHGGLVGYAVDCVIAFAAGSVFGAGVVTETLSIRYTLPTEGDGLITCALLINRAECRCTVSVVEDGVAQPCASAKGSVAQICR